MSSATHIEVSVFAQFPDGATKSWPKVSRKKFIELVRKFKPRYIGTDNPEEIIQPDETIYKFYSKLPPTASLVHVNATPYGIVKLSQLIRENNLKEWNKQSPLKTARALVQLMELGNGVILEPFEAETVIKVGRPKHHKKGGWSQARYARQNEEVVARVANHVQTVLDQNDVAYDLIKVDTKYGMKHATFHTFLSREIIGDLFKNATLRPANVRFISPNKPSITKKPLKRVQESKDSILGSHKRRLIVGIDPGTTVGLGILDLSGHVVATLSQREMSKAQIVRTLVEYGIPVLICSDVTPVPHLVAKIAATFDAEIVHPTTELSKMDKRNLVAKANLSLTDAHEIDALAAALNGYNYVSTRLVKLSKWGLTGRELDLAKALLIRGLSTADAITAVTNMRVSKESQKEVIEQELTPDQVLLNRVNNLLTKFVQAEDTIGYLRSKVATLESDLEQEQRQKMFLHRALLKARDQRIRDVLKEDVVQTKASRIKRVEKQLDLAKLVQKDLRKKINDLQETLWISLREGAYPIKVMPIFSHKGIEQLYRERLSEGDIILILDASGGGTQTARDLIARNPRMIFLKDKGLSPQAEEVLLANKVPFLFADEYNILILDTVAVINPIDFERALHDFERLQLQQSRVNNVQSFMQTLENYRFERQQELAKLEHAYDDYEFEE